MKITYELTDRNFIDFQLYFFDHSPTIQKNIRNNRWYLVFFLALLAFFFVCIFIFKNPLDSLMIMLAGCSIGGICYALIFKKLYRKQHIKNIKKMIAGDNAKYVLGKKTIELPGDGTLKFYEEKTETVCSLDKFSSIEESADNYFIFLDKISAIIIPKTSEYQTDTEISDIIEGIRGEHEKYGTKNNPR